MKKIIITISVLIIAIAGFIFYKYYTGNMAKTVTIGHKTIKITKNDLSKTVKDEDSESIAKNKNRKAENILDKTCWSTGDQEAEEVVVFSKIPNEKMPAVFFYIYKEKKPKRCDAFLYELNNNIITLYDIDDKKIISSKKYKIKNDSILLDKKMYKRDKFSKYENRE